MATSRLNILEGVSAHAASELPIEWEFEENRSKPIKVKHGETKIVMRDGDSEVSEEDDALRYLTVTIEGGVGVRTDAEIRAEREAAVERIHNMMMEPDWFAGSIVEIIDIASGGVSVADPEEETDDHIAGFSMDFQILYMPAENGI